MFLVAVVVPDVVHAVIDNGIATGAAHQVTNRHAMDHAGCGMELTDIAEGPSLHVEVEETAAWVDRGNLIEVKKPACLI
jgi:hypothetical protein